MTLSIFKRRPGARRSRATGWAALFALFALGMLVALAGGATAAATPVPLGTADSFAVLAGSGITNTGPTTVNGDLGTYPTTTITGTASITVTGTNHGGDAVTQEAKTDLVTAYNTAAGEGPTSPIAADLGGQTLTPGVYNSASSIGLTGTLTLNGGGNPNAVFVFQAGSTLTTASASQINLINGAQSCNVFWQVGSSATLGTGSTFRGTILALTSITSPPASRSTGACSPETAPSRSTPTRSPSRPARQRPPPRQRLRPRRRRPRPPRRRPRPRRPRPTPTATTPTAPAAKVKAAKVKAAKVKAAKVAAARAAATSRGFARPARRQVGFTG